MLIVVVEVDLSTGLYKIRTTQRKLNSWYARNQFNTCTEEIVNIAQFPSNEILQRECAEKSSLYGRQGFKRCGCKTV